MKKILFAVTLIISLTFISCRTTQTEIPVQEEWTSAAIPFKVSVTGSVPFSTSGKAYLVKDQSVYLSVKFIGIEVLSIYANNDSAWVYDKSTGTLLAEELGHNPQNGSKLTIGDLQKIMLGINEYGREIELTFNDIQVGLSSMAYIKTPAGNCAGVWSASAMKDNEIEAKGELNWDLIAADWSPKKIPDWRKPSNPKRIVSASDFLYMIFNQF